MDVSPRDRDLAVRTILGEAADQPDIGKAAVAHVILNRTRLGRWGDTPGQVVLARGQFEPWQARAKELNAIRPDSPGYQKTAAIFDAAASGDIPDPTHGASHFLQEDIVRKRRGGSLPDWASGPGMRIGDHTFYRPDGGGLGAINRAIGADRSAPESALAFDEPGKMFRDAGFDLPGSAGGTAPAEAPGAAAPAGGGRTLRLTVPLNPAQPPVRPGSMFEDAGFTLPGATPPEDVPEAAAMPAKPPAYDVAKEAALAAKFGAGSGSVVEGMPIIGPLAQKGIAAANAAIDPLMGRGGDLPFGERYSKNLEIAQQARRLQAEAHPTLDAAGQMAGSVAALAPFAGNAVTGRALGTVGNSIGARFYQGALGGAAIGAGDAALRGENVGQGALTGMAGNAAGVIGGEALGRGYSAVANALRPAPAGLEGTNLIARDWLASAMANETPASIAAARDRMGPHGFAADLNPAMTEHAAGIANRAEPPGSATVSEAYRLRQQGQRAVTEAALDRTLGRKVNIEDMKDLITENRAAAADPLYSQWRASTVHPVQVLKDLMPRLEKVGAFDEAKFLSAATGKPLEKNYFTPGERKSWPTTEGWDLVKRGLDSKIEKAFAKGNKTRAAALIDLKGEMIGEIEKTPAGQVWKQARSEFADRSVLLDQLNAGRDTFLGGRSGLSVDETRNELKGLTGPELQARLIGLRHATDEVMGATHNGDTTLRNKFLAPNNQEKLELYLGKQKADELIKTVEQQHYLTGQNRYVNPREGSATAPRGRAAAALDAPPLPHWDPDIAKPLSFIPPSWVDALRPSTVLQGGRDASYAHARQQLANALVTPAGRRLDDLLRGLHAETTARGRVADTAAALGRAATLAIEGPGKDTVRKRGRTPALRDLRNALVSGAR